MEVITEEDLLLVKNWEGGPFTNWSVMNESFWDPPITTMNFDKGDYPPLEYLVTQITPVVIKAAKVNRTTWLDIMWIVLFSTMLSLAVLGNIAVIWIISCHRRMRRSVTNTFILNLAIADLAMASFNGAPNFVYMLRNDWVFGKMLCVVNNFTANWTVASCVFTMTAISIDRWIAIVKPLEPRMTKTTSWLAIFGIWIGSCFLASPALIYTTLVTEKRHGTTHCLFVWPDGLDPTNSKYEFAYNICLLVLTYLVPMVAMAICYGSMSLELWFTQVGEITQRQINSMIAKRKVVRMFILVVVTFAICWLPYHAYFIYMHIDKKVVYFKWIQHVYLSFFFLAMSQSAINPIIVIGMNSRFRSCIVNFILQCLSCKGRQVPTPAHYVAVTPPLLRRYSQSCSKSRSRSGGTADDNLAGRKFQMSDRAPQNRNGHSQNHQNGARKKNTYITNGHEVINLNHNQEILGSHSPRAVSTRATYC